jgi:hypothetical protein
MYSFHFEDGNGIIKSIPHTSKNFNLQNRLQGHLISLGYVAHSLTFIACKDECSSVFENGGGQKKLDWKTFIVIFEDDVCAP